MNCKKNDIIEEISRDIEYCLYTNWIIKTILLFSCFIVIISYIFEFRFILFIMMFILIIESFIVIFIAFDPFKELDPIDLKIKNKLLMGKYDLNPEEVAKETYAIIKVRRNIKGENQGLKRNIKKLLI